jgi:citrate synthase
MSEIATTHPLHTRIWLETPEPDDAFAARTAYCHGYDVHGELVGRATWAEMLLLLWRGERPDAADARLLDALAVTLANAGPRDPAVHAAMCGAVGGSPAAACLMAALGVGAGRLSGGQEIALCVATWQRCDTDEPAWQEALRRPTPEVESIWPAAEHPPGFEAHGRCCAGTVTQALDALASISPGRYLPWLQSHRQGLEAAADRPLAMAGVAGAAMADLRLDAAQAEMLWLLLRLPGAAAHALEQRLDYKRFPFFAHEIADEID